MRRVKIKVMKEDNAVNHLVTLLLVQIYVRIHQMVMFVTAQQINIYHPQTILHVLAIILVIFGVHALKFVDG